MSSTKQSGGLKALVAAERQARRPDAKPDTKTDAARAALRDGSAICRSPICRDDGGILRWSLTRRAADGAHEPVAVVDDEALVERAIRRAA